MTGGLGYSCQLLHLLKNVNNNKILWCKVIIRRTLAFFTAGEKLVQHLHRRFE